MTDNVSRQTDGDGLRLQGHSLLGWALRRTLIGVAILTVTISAAAWLLYAAIDQEAEASGIAARTPAEIVAPAPANPPPPGLRLETNR